MLGPSLDQAARVAHILRVFIISTMLKLNILSVTSHQEV